MGKLTDEQSVSYGELLAAEAAYLRSFGWIPLSPIVPGAPIFWIDPFEKEDDLSQDIAITMQKARTIDILYRD